MYGLKRNLLEKVLMLFPCLYEENVVSGVPKYTIFYHFNRRRERNVISLLEKEGVKLIGT